MLTVLSVLRSGGEFTPRHVAWLARQVEPAIGAPFVCLADVPVPTASRPLVHDWPGWWAKMEMFRPDLPGDILYFDLDTVICGRIDDLATVGRTTILRDLAQNTGLQSSVMYVTEADRARIWQAWIADPAGWMTRFAKRGDQAVLEQVIPDCQVWQDVRPGRFVSFRKHIRNRGLNDPPAGVGVVVFHGKPRPWKVWLRKGWPFLGRPKWIPPL